MKRIVYLLLIVLMVVSGFTACSVDTDVEQYSNDIVYSVEEVVDMCYTPPNRYEVCYRTWFSNGLVADRWTEVSEEEYKRIREEM